MQTPWTLTLELPEGPLELVPSARLAKEATKAANGINGLRQQLILINTDVMERIVRAAASEISDRRAKGLARELFHYGYERLVGDLALLVKSLSRGGADPNLAPTEEEELEEAQPQGNA